MPKRVTREISLDDVETVAALHESQNERPANRPYIRECITSFPSALCLSGHQVVGFVYTERFAPDVLHLTNMLVDESYRGQGIGSLLLAHMERQASSKYACILVANSELWPHPPRRSPLAFYARNGYLPLFETEHTSVLLKRLAERGAEP